MVRHHPQVAWSRRCRSRSTRPCGTSRTTGPMSTGRPSLPRPGSQTFEVFRALFGPLFVVVMFSVFSRSAASAFVSHLHSWALRRLLEALELLADPDVTSAAACAAVGFTARHTAACPAAGIGKLLKISSTTPSNRGRTQRKLLWILKARTALRSWGC